MYYIGVDLGGTSIKAGLVNEAYEIIQSISTPTKNERASSEVIADIAKLCNELMGLQGISEKEIHSIGIGCPGLVQSKEGIVLSSSNLNFENVNVREILKEYFNIPVYIENDANCAALGEVLAVTIFKAAKAEDKVALEVLDQYYRYIAYGVTNLINILEPETIVLGGGISAQGEYITKPITQYVKEQMYRGLSLKTSIKAAKLGNGAGIIGAALLGYQS